MSIISPEYKLLVKQLEALLTGESNLLTNLSQFSALVFNNVEELNWAGFYIFDGDETLRLGPFQGQVACTKIKLGRGVCGTSATRRESIVVEDVDQFKGHIACDSRSRSELVCPIIIADKLWGVFDLDSPKVGRFSTKDQVGVEALIEVLIDATDW